MYINFTTIKKFFKSTALYFIIIVIYRMLIDKVFEVILAPIYGNVYNYSVSFNIQNILLSWVILFTFAMMTRNMFYAEKGVSNVVIFLIFLLSIIPFTSLIKYGNFTSEYVFANTAYFAFLYFFTFIFRNKIKVKKFKSVNYFPPKYKIGLICVIFFLVALLVCGVYSGFRINFNLDSVYDLRTEAGTYNLPTIMVYLYNWATWINPFMIVYYIRKKKHSFVLILFITQIFMFGYNGMKGPFFFAVIAMMINYLLPKIKMSSLNSFALYGLSGLTGGSLLLYLINGSYALAQTIINRLGMITNMISYAYYNFFTQYTPDYFRSSFLRYFGFQSPYDNISHMISIWFFGFDQGANNGLISDAITNLGLVGIVIMPIIIAFVLKLLDLYTDNLDSRISVCIALYMTIMILSMFILQIFLTGGLLVLIIIFYWMSRENETSLTKMGVDK
ncbi:MAG: oligosaccharide repeat unit polymerase [Lachnospiraceae bacterium]|nr:oligosaccharide repeat unit polymerase [Lachnospiraceae bacterium]